MMNFVAAMIRRREEERIRGNGGLGRRRSERRLLASYAHVSRGDGNNKGPTYDRTNHKQTRASYFRSWWMSAN